MVTPAEEFEGLAERTNAYIDFDKIKNEQEYFEKLKDVFETIPRPDGAFPAWFPRKYYSDIAENNKDLQKRLKEADTESLTALQTAQRYHKSRARRNRLRDESVTAKDTRKATKTNVRGWIRTRGARSDIRGVDTKIIKKLATRNQITKADIRLRTIKVTLNVRGVKQYRSLKTGKFLKNPFKK